MPERAGDGRLADLLVRARYAVALHVRDDSCASCTSLLDDIDEAIGTTSLTIRGYLGAKKEHTR